MDRDIAPVFADQLALAGVEASPDLEARAIFNLASYCSLRRKLDRAVQCVEAWRVTLPPQSSGAKAAGDAPGSWSRRDRVTRQSRRRVLGTRRYLWIRKHVSTVVA